jgi:hypothetical protein
MQFYTNATSLFEMQFYINATSLVEMQFYTNAISRVCCRLTLVWLVPLLVLFCLTTPTTRYVLRAQERMPKPGSKAPWLASQNVMLDHITELIEAVEDGTLQFSVGDSANRFGGMCGGVKSRL